MHKLNVKTFMVGLGSKYLSIVYDTSVFRSLVRLTIQNVSISRSLSTTSYCVA